MFVSNPTDKIELLEAWSKLLPAKKLEQLQKSKGWRFYEEIFSKIEEGDFSELYSKKQSSANSPVNCLVGAFLLCHHRDWSHEELEYQLLFNVETRISLGLKDIENEPFVMRTFYNFINRLSEHYTKTGEHLLQKVFDKLTKTQLKRLGIKTTVQRTDSVLLNSSIQSYSRLSLLVEVLSRLYRILSEADQLKYEGVFNSYKKGGEQYVYSVKGTERQTRLAYLAPVYHKLYTELASDYGEQQEYKIFERVYHEHFKEVTNDKTSASLFSIELREQEELSSGILQSPDDLEATYRKKREESYKGYVGLGIETCHPDNKINLVTQVDLGPNNKDDSVLLEENIEELVEKTPDLEELHQDGGFGSEEMDKKAEANGILLVQTAVKGRAAAVDFTIEQTEAEAFTVSCPNEAQGKVAAEKLKKTIKPILT